MDPTTQTTRLTSSMLWDKGPTTSDVCFALVRTAAEKRKAKEDEEARKRQAREDEMASKKQDAFVLASTLTTGLTCAKDVDKLTVEQLGAIYLSRKEKKPKRKAAMVEAVVGCLGLHPLADAHVAPMHRPLPMLAHLPADCRPVSCCRKLGLFFFSHGTRSVCMCHALSFRMPKQIRFCTALF